MQYQELTIDIENEFQEILIAELTQLGYDSFLEEDNLLKAYILKDDFLTQDVNDLLELRTKYEGIFQFSYTYAPLVEQNWNAQWEADYPPVIIDDKCIIKAHFHQIEQKYPFEIWITPKMSFGTGHHDTTSLMIKTQWDINHQDKNVLDAGTGTGVLAIMAEKLGAKYVDAYDIDEWSVLNAKENIALNNCENVAIQQGIITNVKLLNKYDIILANIQRNVLLEELKYYATHLITKGVLLVSGFYEKDIVVLQTEAQQQHLLYKNHFVQNDWVVMRFEKV